ncbi:hypothetical protein Pan161_44520 [Gimesia algae]|uniref:Uncharacterized protein n=1 Tax=Gimesia algae TaxID=2527971 RepID=A0A517VIH1_9PLAN|nr:hypothetical protein Pan161_44520 [Gimesia algae]
MQPFFVAKITDLNIGIVSNKDVGNNSNARNMILGPLHSCVACPENARVTSTR